MPLPAQAVGYHYKLNVTELPNQKVVLTAASGDNLQTQIFLQDSSGTMRHAPKLSGKHLQTFAGDGTAMSSDGKIWINGKLIPMRDLCPKFGELLDDGYNLLPLKGNKHGVYLIQAHKENERKVFIAPPVVIEDKDKKALKELKIAKLYPNVLSGTGLPGSSVSVNLDNDEDRFYVRVKGIAAQGPIQIKVETIFNASIAFDDDPTEHTLLTTGDDVISKSMVLVADDVDDHHEAFVFNGKPDNSPDDQTHKIQLGGHFKVSSIKIGTSDWQAMNYDLPTKVKKTVKVQFVNCRYGNMISSNPIWTTSEIERVEKYMRLAYSQVGINFDFSLPVKKGAVVSFTGTLDDDEIPQFSSTTGKLYFPSETKNLIEKDPSNDFHNTLTIYLIGRMGLGGDLTLGIATPPKTVNSIDVKFQNKIILTNFRQLDYTAAHEALHVLANAVHGFPPHSDFPAEYGNANTIWTQPGRNEDNRRNNHSIGSTKRISLAQEIKIHSSPLAK